MTGSLNNTYSLQSEKKDVDPSAGKPLLVFMSGLVCNKPILQGIMNDLGQFGDVHFIDYFNPELDTMEKLATYCQQEIEKLGAHKPIVLVTFSMGGYISPLLLEKMQESGTLNRIKAVCGIESTPYADLPARQQQRNARLDLIAAGKFPEVVESVLQEWYTPETFASRPDVIEESRAMITALGQDIFIAQTRAIRDRPDMMGRLRYFTMPVLTISAQASALFKAADPRYGKTPVEALREGIPAVPHDIVVVPNAGHLVPRTNSEEVSHAIECFLKDNGLLHTPDKATHITPRKPEAALLPL